MESGVTAVRMVRILGENERGNKETEAAYNHDSVGSFRELPTRKVRGLTRGLIVAAETRPECILMCLMTSAVRERTRGYSLAKVCEMTLWPGKISEMKIRPGWAVRS